MKLTHFFLHLLPDLLGLLPVKAYATRLFLDPHGLDEGRQTFRNSSQYRGIALFGELDFLPILLDRFFVLGHRISIDVRVAANQFLTEGVNHRADVVVALFRTDFGIKNKMEEEVPHFFLDFLWIAFHNGIRKLKRLLNGQVAEAFRGLLFVPRTLRTQLIHDGQ